MVCTATPGEVHLYFIVVRVTGKFHGIRGSFRAMLPCELTRDPKHFAGCIFFCPFFSRFLLHAICFEVHKWAPFRPTAIYQNPI